MVPRKSFTFVTNRIRCNKKKQKILTSKFKDKVNFCDKFCIQVLPPSNQRCRIHLWQPRTKLFFPPCTIRSQCRYGMDVHSILQVMHVARHTGLVTELCNCAVTDARSIRHQQMDIITNVLYARDVIAEQTGALVCQGRHEESSMFETP